MAETRSPSLRNVQDDLDADVPLTAPARRVVSLVPSLTEALAATVPERLVGATDWCTHPAELDVPRVRGTKNPDLRAIRDLAPDLVIANQEENRELDVRRLRESGVAVWVTRIETVAEALDAMDRLFLEALEVPVPGWLAQARDLWDVPPRPARASVAVPIWRDPWMVVGAETYTSDLLARVGLDNAMAGTPGRYPQVGVGDIEASGAGLVLLPDEPYVFSATDGPEAFTLPTSLVEGRLITWYGPAMVEAHAVLADLGPAPA
ncbi:MAG: ABC-type Fe3+-hydroxamate transport system, periplasmic component [uncultured Nocardioides sp.]|uniref:ABC-type Fe3+-hydroxamate transport system, periplasmic component n=1 Tax=uncultured Nocardioides sp. TaxID=198441 RepID=A0A6J4MZ65_9ACTN|nr:MAG: ABC-type Fe3+-hydroxamate transport system, periplasmic component [uncultured Nocardioides sp.]